MENYGSNNRVSIETLANTNGLIANLNLDMTQSILSRISIEFVSRSRAVCKLWRALLRKPKTGFLFAVSECQEEVHLCQGYSDEVSIDDAPISYKTLSEMDLGLGTSRNIPVKLVRNNPNNPVIFGSCNGLVCLPVLKDDKQCLVYICNPMTRECVFLPVVDLGGISSPEFVGGFGYCQSTNQYKVVQVVYDYFQFEKQGRVQVYTLGGGCGWRSKGEIRYAAQEKLVYANDALYWKERIGDDWKINVFDLVTETFSTLAMPQCHDVVRGYIYLVSLSGYLCLCHITVEKSVIEEDEEKRLDTWMLKKEQQKKNKIAGYFPVDENDDLNRWVWIKEFSKEYKSEFYESRDYEPFAITDNNQVLMWEVRDWDQCRVPILYDRDTESTNDLWNEELMYAQAIPHMNSFVSLKDLGEKSARYIP